MKRHVESHRETALVAQDVINFIIRGLNSSALLGVLNQKQHKELLIKTTDSLFEICMMSNYTTAEENDEIGRAELLNSSYSLIVLLLSLAYEGKLYKLEVARIEASKVAHYKVQS